VEGRFRLWKGYVTSTTQVACENELPVYMDHGPRYSACVIIRPQTSLRGFQVLVPGNYSEKVIRTQSGFHFSLNPSEIAPLDLNVGGERYVVLFRYTEPRRVGRRGTGVRRDTGFQCGIVTGLSWESSLSEAFKRQFVYAEMTESASDGTWVRNRLENGYLVIVSAYDSPSDERRFDHIIHVQCLAK
jgi:hypothetical protein